MSTPKQKQRMLSIRTPDGVELDLEALVKRIEAKVEDKDSSLEPAHGLAELTTRSILMSMSNAVPEIKGLLLLKPEVVKAFNYCTLIGIMMSATVKQSNLLVQIVEAQETNEVPSTDGTGGDPTDSPHTD